ncbi:MAG: hypothetical protein ACRDHW_00685 [Ktedonobacteraceae bacterium]
MSIQDFLPYLNIVLLIGVTVGGFFAMRKGYSQESGVIQERVIDALKEEVATLRSKVDDLEKERATQDRVIATIRYALRQNGTRITIAGDFVTLSDRVGTNKVVRIQDKLPVHPAVPDDDDDIDAV